MGRRLVKQLLLWTPLALVATAAVAAEPTPLNLKPGQWEYTVTMRMDGLSAPEPSELQKEQLAKLPPEQRARIESALKQVSDMRSGQPTISQGCVKKEDLSKLNPFAAADDQCASTVVESSATKLVLKRVCNTTDNKTTSDVTIEAVSPVSSSLISITNGTSSGHPMKLIVEGTGKWLADACGETH
ncbi:MAG TPA: DUF3617 domain-containing protein [Methylocystis sp.]|nr:DUF3617 domain-containing protein [Methylocystis sp.]